MRAYQDCQRKEDTYPNNNGNGNQLSEASANLCIRRSRGRSLLCRDFHKGQKFLCSHQYPFLFLFHLFFDNLDKLSFKDYESFDTPTFYKGILNIDEAHDTFLKLDGFTKGFVVINGFNIGRYWNTAGPQTTLYVPAPLLKSGGNEIIVFETDGCDSQFIEFVDTPELGDTILKTSYN